MVPVPGQLCPVQAFRIGSPHGKVLVGGHIGMHSQRPFVQLLPGGQRVPAPQAAVFGHRFAIVWPQSTDVASVSGHIGTHSHIRASGLQRSLSLHPPLQRPPHPSSWPQVAVAGQLGVHEHMPVIGSHTPPVPGQRPMQRPPHPSLWPHIASAGQFGVHEH